MGLGVNGINGQNVLSHVEVGYKAEGDTVTTPLQRGRETTVRDWELKS